jgi:hypothetical protein
VTLGAEPTPHFQRVIPVASLPCLISTSIQFYELFIDKISSITSPIELLRHSRLIWRGLQALKIASYLDWAGQSLPPIMTPPDSPVAGPRSMATKLPTIEAHDSFVKVVKALSR